LSEIDSDLSSAFLLTDIIVLTISLTINSIISVSKKDDDKSESISDNKEINKDNKEG
jgi:hypothetical protein